MCWSSGCFPSLCGWCEVSNLGCRTSQYSHWSEQWVCCVAICTKVVEVAAFIDHTDRCRLQAQRGLNARVLWACGYMVSVRPGQPAAESRWYSTCHFGKEQIMIFHGAFYFLKSIPLALLFSFCRLSLTSLLLGFVFFPLLSAVLLFLCRCCSFTWLICQLYDTLWITVCQRTIVNCCWVA